MSDNENNKERSGLERHFATVVTSIILVAVLWVGNTIMEQGQTQVQMNGTINVMNVEITHLKEMVRQATNGIYTEKDARSAHSALEYQINDLRRRLEEVEDNFEQGGN